MEHDIPFQESGTTFSDFPLFLGIFQWDEPTKRVPFTAEPEISEILSKWKAPKAIRGREDTRVWYREKMFSQMVSYDFLLHGALHGYFLYLVSAPPEKPTRRCKSEEGYAIRSIIGVTL